MRLIAFVYDFPHFKSTQGLFVLKRAGFDDVLAVGAPWRKLPLNESKYQFRTHDMSDAHHPRDACRALGFSYMDIPHESVRLAPDEVGLILGARILPGAVVDSGGPIVNLHPGILPLNRGLDTLKWAVHDDMPQAVTAHLIDHRIDRGFMLYEEIVRVHGDDSPADIYNRLMWRQIAMIPQAVQLARMQSLQPIERGIYRKPMTPEQDHITQRWFSSYKLRYEHICGNYKRERKAA